MGSIVSVISVIGLLFILWEALVSHRPVISSCHINTRIEFIHSFPPTTHSYSSVPGGSSLINKLPCIKDVFKVADKCIRVKS